MGPKSKDSDEESENDSYVPGAGDILFDPDDGHELDFENAEDRQTYWDINNCT